MMNNNIKKQVTVTTNNNGEREDINMNSISNSNTTNNMQEENTMSNNTYNNKATEAIANKTNNDMGAVGALGIVPFDNLEEIIPEDERAVTEQDAKNKTVVVVRSIELPADIASEIPENEREEIELPIDGLEDIIKCGCFSPVAGMKGLITDTGHIFWAKRYIEPKKGEVIKYRQQYKNNKYSEQMVIDKADLVSSALCHFRPNRISESHTRTIVTKFIMKASRDYYGKLLYFSEGLDIISILGMLMSECDNLPVEIVRSILDQPDRLYSKVIQIIKDKRLNIVDEHEAYYTLYKEQIEIIAMELNIRKNQLLKQLKEYRFLYLTDSSDGYQTCVRFKPYGEFFPATHTEWCYCIYKLDFLAKKRLKKTEE